MAVPPFISSSIIGWTSCASPLKHVPNWLRFDVTKLSFGVLKGDTYSKLV